MKQRTFFIALLLLIPMLTWSQASGKNYIEALNSIVWTQVSGEHYAVAQETYALAKIQIKKALADSKWTAALEQTGSFGTLKPAVVFDIDETILDNSPYFAWATARDVPLDATSALKWSQSGLAKGIPGAVEFTQYAESLGVKVIYVTNRTKAIETATLQNLKNAGFLVDDDGGNILSENEMPDWGSDKTTRRAYLAQNYRILMLFGDCLNDFLSGTFTGTETRNALVEKYLENWGSKWIILTNSMYGDWDQGLYNFASLNHGEIIDVKMKSLQVADTICTSSSNTVTPKNNELLNSVVWVQQSGEFIAVAHQIYSLAKFQLDNALNDPAWTAALEQTGNFSNLPPAIVLDIDETVLDNSPSEACLIKRNADLDSAAADNWVKTEKAKAIPGAVQLTQYAKSLGVTVFYVTNRIPSQDEATIQNLKLQGFPVEEDGSTLLSSLKLAEWGSDKITRRSFLAQNYRILLLFGDDLNDFFTGSRTGSQVRNALAEQYVNHWGSSWMILPNSMYGSWEQALSDFKSLPRDQVIQAKYNALQIPYDVLPSFAERYSSFK